MPPTRAEHTLVYHIHGWSSYSANYHPSNIQCDRPNDQSSRWSSDSNYPPQYITLKLQKAAIVTAITFGKYEKIHVCNLRKFTVYGGVSEDHMMELLTDGLKNDSNKETFVLKHELQGKRFPCRFIKVVPLMSWGPSFNFSIWHVQLTGIDDPELVSPQLRWFNNYREQEAIRLCLKHFRQKDYNDVFEALQKKSKVSLEDPILTELHQTLVQDNDSDAAEESIENSGRDGLFQEYVSNQNYTAKWTTIIPLNGDGIESSSRPGMRGGHQMCIDTQQQLIFLLGGWDGMKDLSDFWVYNINNGQWQCISEDTKLDGGPSARSCHKMCLDRRRRSLYILGRYLDSGDRVQVELKSDFYKYNLDTGLWETISLDTATDGGPNLIFDHQMQYDAVTDLIFVFGGRILTSITNDDQTLEPLFSGLFSYHIESNTWTKVREDYTGCITDVNRLKGRSGHSMLIDEKARLIYIFAGQRGKDHQNDFLSYNIETGEVKPILSKSGSKELPSAGFTQRSTIDSNLGEIFVLSGLSKDREKKEESIRNSFWVFNLKSNKWSCVYKNEHVGQQYWNKMHSIEPRPRFAHQLVYDSINKTHYLFGGNPGKSTTMKLRLDDFWRLQLERSSVEDIVRRCKYMIRKQRYKELTEEDPIQAVTYLQDEVSKVINHADQGEREEFESLATSLFTQHSPMPSSDEEEQLLSSDGCAFVPSHQYTARTKVFEELVMFFPAHMVQPVGNITDFILV